MSDGKKKLSFLTVISTIICVVFVCEAAAPAAAIGNQQFFWWIFLILTFLLPYGMVVAELGTTYDGEGGIYDWVRDGLGDKWGARISYYYWVNYPLWIASLATMFPDILGMVFGVEFNIVAKMGIELAFVWIVYLMGRSKAADSEWVLNGGALIKVAVAVIVGALGIWFAMENGFANDMSATTFLPELTNKQLEEKGIDLYCLGAMSQGIRCLLTTEGHKVETMADCDGLRIRVPSSDVYQETVAAWGCSPTAMSSSQVITSLANGTIEGFESDPASITARGQQESFKYYIETYHIASLNLLMINKTNLEKLPVEYQDIIKNVFKEKCIEQCVDRVGANEAEVEVIKAAGVEVVTPTAEALQEFIDADKAFQQKKIAEWGVEDIVNEALEYVAANAK